MARRGAFELGREGDEGSKDTGRRGPSAPPPPMDEWVRVPDAPSRSQGASSRGTARRTRAAEQLRSIPDDVATAIRNAAVASTAKRREVLVTRMADAIQAFERHRYQEAVRLGKQVDKEAPGVAAVQEMVGLGAYRMGRWREASKQLEAFRLQTGEVEHDPVLMDCYRALGRKKKVAELFTEIRQYSPSADVLAEARIVAAGALADGGDLNGAISLLTGAGAAKALRNPAERHLRQWFALGDLYERAGDVPKARELYQRVFKIDREAYGVADRLDALGREGRGQGRRRPASRKEPAIRDTVKGREQASPSPKST